MNRLKKLILPFLLTGLLSLSIVGCTSDDKDTDTNVKSDTQQTEEQKDNKGNAEKKEDSDNSETRMFTDQFGNEVELPKKIEKVADVWDAHSQVMLLLGQADKLVTTTERIQRTPWFAEVYPGIKDVIAPIKNDTIQLEELVAQNPDVVICLKEDEVAQVEGAGLKAVRLGFQDFDGLKETIRLTGELMGEEAEEKADEYIKYLEGNIEKLAEKTKDIEDSERPKILHIFSGEDLTKVDGAKSIIGEWMKLAGGINAIESEANHVDVNLEEIIATNPDIIIIGGTGAAKGIETIKNDPAWADVKAVQEDKLYCNPVGTWKWDRYSAEEALQVLWAGTLIHPELFGDIDMVKETKEFYKKFYDFELSDDQAQRILDCKNPEGVDQDGPSN
ncbi:MAG: ABC transporter substrate-binding protein [Andreesenia angusta]|nr:ABC transporter substrate-binding protein [Andreesenia angusta]